MTILSNGLRAACLALVLSGGALAAAPVHAAHAQAQATPATEADFAGFRQTVERFRLDEILRTMMFAPLHDPNALPGVPVKIRDAYVVAFERRFTDRQGVIFDLIIRKEITAFSHDEVVRLVAIAASPAGEGTAAALLRSVKSGGALSPEQALSDEPALKTLKPDDRYLLGRYFTTFADSMNAADAEVDAISEAAQKDALAAGA